MKSGFLLNVVIRQGSTIFQLFASKNEPLLVWRDSFFVLDFGLYIFNGVWSLNFKGNGFASQGFDKNLHTTSEPQNKMQSRLFLDIVVWQSAAIFQLFSSKNEPLLIWWNSFLVLNFGLYIFNAIRRLNFESNGLSSQGLDKDLHTTSEPQN